jgi:flagella basal body P-ring formation protein FlgA
VTLQVPFTRVVSTVPIRAGERITPDRVRTETGTGAPVREGTVASADHIAGKSAKRFVPAGAVILLSMIAEPAAVSRGDALQVEVRSGNARLRFDGLAQASGASGAIVPVRMRDTGRMIHARVAGQGRVILDLSAPAERP